MTMSTSSAPAATAYRTSASLTSRLVRPLGKAVATLATWMPVPFSSSAATLPVTLVMLEAVRDFRAAYGRQVGVKAAGGIRTAKDAIRYLVLVNETAGEEWLDPRWFRLGASSLLNDLLMQRTKLATGRYSGPDYFTLD